jgi:hypothetical protein
MARVKNSAVVARQLPEHIREDYPTFVAFVEAYYEFLQTQGVDFSTIRDIDRTLEDFIVQFKKELSYNLPNVTQDERFLLQKIKDQYLAKGSEGSYKLLFRLLYGKDVDVFYPGQQMLRASDGRWNQEISVFAKVDFGDADDVVGKLVDIQTAGRILRVLVDKKQDLVGEIDRIVLIDPTLQIYEFFLDKRFFGIINPTDRIRYLDEFQATILPTTRQLTVTQPGKNFRVGQVFELRSGTGTGALLKVTAVTPTGGIQYAEFIKFGIGYTANFAISILATNSVTSRGTNVTSSSTLIQNNTYSSAGAGTISASSSSTTVTGSGTSFGSVGNVKVGDELWTTDATPLLVGVVKSIASTTSLTLTGLASEYESGTAISGSYTGSYTFRNDDGVGSLYAPGGTQASTFLSTVADRTVGFDEQGYVNLGDYITETYVDGTYAGSLIREFSLNSRNAQVDADDPAIININLGAIARYPGYFETNNGFLDDSIFIQDSRYYQAFSYVIKIDERLESYKSAVKTMLHPAGMALFGEFNITNTYNLSLALESLVKSLGIGLEDEIRSQTDLVTLSIGKALSSTLNTPSDNNTTKLFSKALSTSLDTPEEAATLSSVKSLSTSLDTPDDSDVTRSFSKALSTSYTGSTDAISSFDIAKALTDTPIISEILSHETAKYVDMDTLDPQEHQGYIQVNSYYGQDYIIFDDEYSEGSRESTFTTP